MNPQKLTQSDRKKAAVIEAAIEEFKEKGFQGASMDSISARAGVSKRTVYNHFSSKDLLFQQLALQFFQYAAEMTHLEYQPLQPLEVQLLQFAEKEIALLALENFRDMARVMLSECIHSPQLVATTMGQLNEQQSDLQLWISAAIEDGRLKEMDPEQGAAQLLGLIKASAFWPQILMAKPVPGPEQRAQIAESSVGMFLSYYRQ